MKSKAWLVFILVLIMCGQFVLLSMFHNVQSSGLAYGSSVIAIGKWNYVSASVVVTITPNIIYPSTGQTRQVTVVFPNGTTHMLQPQSTASSFRPYSFKVNLPMSGVPFSSGATSGPVGLSQNQPLNVTITQNLQNASQYVSTLIASSNANPMGGLEIDLYPIIVYGDASVSVVGYGFAL